jgi:hypothetical protein
MTPLHRKHDSSTWLAAPGYCLSVLRTCLNAILCSCTLFIRSQCHHTLLQLPRIHPSGQVVPYRTIPPYLFTPSMSLEFEAMRAYITAKDATQYDGMMEGLVAVYMTHNLLTMRAIDLRLDLHATVANIKAKLYTHCGTKISHMRLFLRTDGETVWACLTSLLCLSCVAGCVFRIPRSCCVCRCSPCPFTPRFSFCNAMIFL